MRVLFLSQLVPFPVDAGPKVRSYHVLQHLAAQGHEVTLLAFQREGDRPEQIEHLRAFCHAVHTVPLSRSFWRDVWYLGLSLIQGQPMLIRRDHVPAMHNLLQELVHRQRFDIIHADQLWMAQYALAARETAAAGEKDIRFVLDQHNAVYLIPERLALQKKNPFVRFVLRREARVLRRYELATCQQFDRVVWVTDEDRQALDPSLMHTAKDQVIPICVDTQDKPLLYRPDGFRVTFLGGLHWPPNAEGMIWFARKIWPRIRAAIPDAVLTVIGKNPPQEIAGGDIPGLQITGYVEDVTPYLQETAAFIVPLHAGGGMRVKIIDAWAWGLPIVSTTIGAEGIDYQHGENILIGDSEAEFAAHVIRLCEDSALACRLARCGRQTAEQQYEWRQVYGAWEQVYG